MATDPDALFEEWFTEAALAEPAFPEAVALATATSDGAPSVRMVLMKGHDRRGFTFYTNSQSRKGEELQANPRAAMLFYWKSLNRQVRIEGAIDRVDETEADAYFATRARESRIGAWASNQSRPMEARSMFEQRYREIEQSHEGQEVPRPPHWKGYRLVPQRFEFWTDRAHRLHERRLFTRSGEGWTESLLFP